jgi:hypothetical protein
MMGYTAAELDSVYYNGYDNIEVDLTIDQTVIALDEVVITPGRFSLIDDIPITKLALRSENVRTFPQLGEDIYRAVSRLPGVTSNDFKAGFYVRGGDNSEVLVQLDGMELQKPFHLQELDGFMSIIDVESIRGVELITGGFTAEYGDKLSGVFDLKTITTNGRQSRTSLAISFVNARLLTTHKIANGRGHWMLLARRGYLDILANNAEDTSIGAPRYYDVLGKVFMNLSPVHSISAHILTAYDNWEIPMNDDDDDDAHLNTNHVNQYGWITLHSQWSEDIRSRTLLSYTGISDLMHGTAFDSLGIRWRTLIRDESAIRQYGLKQDWVWSQSENSLLKWGFEAEHSTAFNNYFHRHEEYLGLDDWLWTEGYNLKSVFGQIEGVGFGSYISQKLRPVKPLAVEIGLRLDQETWLDDYHWSPRFNAAFNITPFTSFRVGWGHYYQSARMPLALAKFGDYNNYPAEKAVHWVAGIEHELPGGIKLRIEAYRKDLSSLPPHYITWQATALRPLKPMDDDLIRVEPDGGESVGLEFYIRKETGGALSYWLSYTLSKTTENIDGRAVPRYFDQRHTVYADISWKPSRKWRLNLAWQYHTGWPYTEAEVVDLHYNTWNDRWDWMWGPGPLYAEQYPDYQRVDLRINRSFFIGNSSLTLFLEIRNFLDQTNPREHQNFGTIPEGDITEEDIVITHGQTEGWMQRVPSFGIIWDF